MSIEANGGDGGEGGDGAPGSQGADGKSGTLPWKFSQKYYYDAWKNDKLVKKHETLTEIPDPALGFLCLTPLVVNNIICAVVPNSKVYWNVITFSKKLNTSQLMQHQAIKAFEVILADLEGMEVSLGD